MACVGCSCSTGKDSDAKGCQSNGGCATGGCNRRNTYDWISAAGIRDAVQFDIVEVSFKNGSRKEFFKNPPYTRTETGDQVLVESFSGGYDLGQISLSGDLVKLQMKRKRLRSDAKLHTVIRRAHERDMERLDELRKIEKPVMIRARAVSRSLGLNMKVCDVEFQADGRKCTFLYTADDRVDFRELIRHYAKEFKVKIEMRQIGARQESARIGGLGNCGRELCCSTWLAEFKSVNTAAARYQNLAINQTKLSGMCGRLKCCLNYELDAYIDALEDFPDRAERLKTTAGMAILVKTDVFKRLMFYTYAENRGKFFSLHVDQIWEALALIKNGQFPASLEAIEAMAPQTVLEEDEEETFDFENVHDVIQLPLERKKKKKKKKNRGDSQAASIEKFSGSDSPRAAPQPRQDDRNRRPPENQGNQNRPKNGPPPRPNSDGSERPAPRNDNRNERRPEPRNENRPRPEPRTDNRNARPEPRNDNRNDRPEPRNENRNENRGEGRNQNRPPQPPKQGGNRPPQPPKKEGNKPPPDPNAD